MPLPKATTARKALHTRRIECQGFEREDGLIDVEGHLVDTKTYSFPNKFRGQVVAGEPIHEMWIRITIDKTLTIVAIDAASDSHPFQICPSVVPNFQTLVGLQIVGGFQRKVKERLGNTEGCTHLVDLVGTVATTAFQTVAGRAVKPAPGTIKTKPALVDSCRGWAADGVVVKEVFPDFFTGPGD
jgi:hypothetical protein